MNQQIAYASSSISQNRSSACQRSFLFQDKGAPVLIDPKAVLFMIGAKIDYETTRLSSKFTFRNPNQTDACGCGESVTLVPGVRED